MSRYEWVCWFSLAPLLDHHPNNFIQQKSVVGESAPDGLLLTLTFCAVLLSVLTSSSAESHGTP